MRGKRLFDLALLLPALPAFALLLGMLAFAVLLCDGRPLFFHQLRVGRDHRRFRIWKLRTMTSEPDARQRRPTRLGRFLRQRGLDEIPQLWNVLCGDMSLVGPRPLTPEDAARLCAQHPPFAARFAVPPGLTGLAQVCGARGAVLTARLDTEYVRARNTAWDLVLLMRTLWINVVGKRTGARGLPR